MTVTAKWAKLGPRYRDQRMMILSESGPSNNTNQVWEARVQKVKYFALNFLERNS